MDDGLYLFGQWVSEASVALTKQANDLSSPQTLQTTFSNVFSLPDTTAIRVLLDNGEQLDAASRKHYRLIPAKLISEGEVLFYGNASLLSFQGGWKVNLSGFTKGLFEQLGDIKLGNVDLNQYNHPWTMEVVDSLAEVIEGVCYPCIDYGTMENGVFSQDTIAPAVFSKTLINAMLRKVGYVAKGNWLTDPLLNRIVLPFVEDEPKAYDAQWVLDRQARVTLSTPMPIPSFSGIELVLPFDVDDDILGGFTDGKQNCYKAESRKYVPDVPMRLNVQFATQFNIKVDIGAVEAIVQVLKNGNVVTQSRLEFGGPYNLTMAKTEQLKLDVKVDLRALDEVQLKLIIRKQTLISQFMIIGILNSTTTFAAFIPDSSINDGDSWPVAANLPDMSCAELLKTIALATSSTWDVDDVVKTLELKPLNDVLSDEANATDLSHCVEESVEPENLIVLSPYGQKNLLKWKEMEDKSLVGYGNGSISVDAQNIPLETPLFELPFSAVVDSQKLIGGYGNPPFIETRTITGSGANVQVQKKKTTPRLLLVEPTRSVTVTVNIVTADLTVRPTKVRLMACWWAPRPAGAQTQTNSFSLAFDRPSGTFGREQTMIQRYFGGLKRVLRKPRQLTVSAYMRPYEFADLNLYSPVRLKAVRLGSLDVNDNYFYINQIKNYQSVSGRCQLVLVPY